MPSKRDPSRQRRQARNRAEREARLARRQTAAAPKPVRPEPTPGGSSGSTSSSAAADTAPGRTAGSATRRKTFDGRPPGTRAAYYCLILTLFAFGFSFIFDVPVDEDGRPLNRDETAERNEFLDLRGQADQGGLDEAQQERLTELERAWEVAADRTEALFTATWPISVVYILAVGCGVLAVVMARWENPGRGWMRLLIAMVLLSLLSGGSFLLLAPVIALAVAHYQYRKATLIAAGGPAGGAPAGGLLGGLLGRRRVIDVDAAQSEPSGTGGAAQAGDDGADGDGTTRR
jgi:hypothetical protein